jgi:short-subunit dehydrogenase
MATALITGGTSGIGAAFARALAGRGDDLVLVARNAERLSTMATELTERYGVRVATIAADLSDRADTVRVAERLSLRQAQGTEGPIDLLVSNAGFGIPVSLLAEDTTPHEAGFDVMIRAVLMLGAAAGRAMKERGSGAIINVSSTAGFVTMGNYSAIKAWVTSYTEGLANELAGTGVTATALCPGWVRTEFHERAEIGVGGIPDFLWLDADDLVGDCLADVARGRVISIPTRRYQLLIGAARHLPRPALRALSKRLSSSRHGEPD